MIQTRQYFTKGIDERLSDVKGDELRFKKLQNVRLQKRGATASITRMSGFNNIYETQNYANWDIFYDSIFYLNYLIILFYDDSQSKTILQIIDVDSSAVDTTIEVSTSKPTNGYSELTLLEDTIFISNYEKLLSRISGSWYLSNFISTVPTVVATTSSTSGSLEQQENYWYKARYKYYEGHITTTCNPFFINTDTDTSINITIDTSELDLDGNRVDVEIFRKKGSADYYKIKQVTPTSDSTVFEDTGEPNLYLLDDESYVWAKTCETEEIVRDRLVKANNTYESTDNQTVSSGSFYYPEITDGEEGIPYNTTVDIYTQVRKNDGTKTVHKFQDRLISGTTDAKILNTVSDDDWDGNSSEYKEISTVFKFNPNPSTDSIPFYSLEMYNSNVPSLATEDEDEVDQDRPTNPHIFLGFKHIKISENSKYEAGIYDYEWNTNQINLDNGTANLHLKANSVDYDEDVTPLSFYDDSGGDLNYSILAYENDTIDKKIFRLAFLEALQESIRKGKCKLKLTGTNGVNGGLSTERPDGDFIDLEVNVIGLKDTSLNYEQIFTYGSGNTIAPANYNHLYLILESGTPFDDFDNISANNSDVKADYEATTPSSYEHRYEFELVGLLEEDTEDSTVNSLTDYDLYDYDYRLKLTDYTDYNNDSGIYVNNQTSGGIGYGLTQGWKKRINNKFEDYILNDWNEYVTIVTEEDIKQSQTNYTNQLIWSNSYIRESNVSRVRNFPFENVKYISERFGKIIKISYILGKLIVFCERGVNIINVGEVLTRQVSGQTFVDSSSLLNDDYWALESLQNISARSIVKHENKLFFCDGYDVWMYDGQFKNITDGAITLDSSVEYIGSYDPRHKEYHLSYYKDTNDFGTYTYSLELDSWSGKHTFTIKTAEHRKNNLYGITWNGVKNEASKFNSGNLYGGSAINPDGVLFSSELESVGQYFENPLMEKRFRKIFIDGNLITSGNYNAYTNGYSSAYDGLTSMYLSYSNDGVNYNDTQLYSKRIINGIINAGVDPNYSNGYYMYWKITSTDTDFQFNSIGFFYQPKIRR